MFLIFSSFFCLLYSFEFSMGVIFPLYKTEFIRNNLNFKHTQNMYKDLSIINLYLMFEVNYVFAFETAFGFTLNNYNIKNKYDTNEVNNYINNSLISKKYTEIIFPIYIRFQKEFGEGVLYSSFGTKYIFSVNVHDSYDIDKFMMYVPIALGGELRLARNNYLGLRLEYDFNVYKKIKQSYNDILSVNVTYRYAFNSKYR